MLGIGVLGLGSVFLGPYRQLIWQLEQALRQVSHLLRVSPAWTHAALIELLRLRDQK